MEGYARHSRTHSRAPPHPPTSAGTGAPLYKKSYTNGGPGTGFTDYDDVFGGPPKFGVSPFTPRAEDYSEIFGSFLSSRASSIPMLDLPPVDNAVAAFDVSGCSGSEYSDVFGGFEFADFAVHYDELFERSHGGEESSDDAWTRVGTESLSEESDPSACSERNPYFLNEEFHQSLDCNQLNVSYHKVNLGPVDSNLTYIAQLSAVPGYTYAINGSSSFQKEDAERYSSGVADDVILCEHSSGNISVETLQKASPVLPHGFVREQLNDYDKNAGLAHRTGNYYVNPTFVSDSDISLKAEPSQFPSLSIPPSSLVGRKEDSASSASEYEVPKNRTGETSVDSGSLHFFDLELDAGSSAVASAAAMKEAMDRAKVKLRSAKELMERKKDGLKGPKPATKNETSGEGKARIDSDESSLNNDQQQKASKREKDQFMNSGKDVQDASRTSQVSFDPIRVEHVVNGVPTHANEQFTENHSPSLDHGLIDGDGEPNEATLYYELLNNCHSKVEPNLTDSATKQAYEKNTYHFGNANGKAASLKHHKRNMEGMNDFAEENEYSKSDEEPFDPRESRRRLRATKAASRKEFHQKMLKVAQEVHETAIGDHVETEMKLNMGGRGNRTERNFEIWPEGKKNEIRFDQADQHVDSEGKHKWESDISGSEFRLSEDFAQAEYGKKEIDTCWFEGEERRIKEFCVGEETLGCVKEVQEREEYGNGVNEAHEFEERKDACSWKEKDVRKRVVCTIGEDIFLVNEALDQKEINGLSGSTTGQDSGVRHSDDEGSLKRLDAVWERVGNETKLQETHETKQDENNVDEAAISHRYEMKMKDSFELEKSENHELSTEDSESGDRFDAFQDEEIENLIQENKLEKAERIYNGAPEKEQQRFNDYVQPELSSDEQNNFPERILNNGSEFVLSSNGPSSIDENESRVPATVSQCDDLKSFDAASSHDETDTRPNAMACEGEKYTAHTTQDVAADKKKGHLRCNKVNGRTDSKVFKTADLCPSAENLQKTEAGLPKKEERKENTQKRSHSSNISQGVEKEGKAINGYLDAEDKEKTEKSRRNDGPEKQHPGTFDEEKEKERERKLEERVRKIEELREKERERKLDIERLRKLEEEREMDKVKELEEERLRKLEEEWEREREREKDRMGLDLKASEAHERASAEARERAERAVAERATAEARHRVMAEARERLEKACAEAREKSLPEKTSAEARLRAERAAVERATAEARERAVEKARAERATFEARVERSSSEKIPTSVRDMGLRHCVSSSDLWDTDKSDGLEGESAQRCKARLERHRRTVERVAKALAEKNMRDLIAQREQAERNRLAETLDVEIKRWSNGKEGNLRALLSTLQYILGQDSGWQPIPLTEVITSAAVKKAYRKATLYVHPDKLQQRGATVQQKYICEKVFDLLKDAWNRFNSEER